MLTIPNLISLLRLFGAPLIIWLANSGYEGWVILVLIIASTSDYLDGKVARALNQRSRLGEILDPTTDRIYIAAILYLLLVREILPSWLVGALVLRDLAMLILNGILKSKRLPLLKVNFMGKAATFNLLYALPLLYLASIKSSYSEIAFICGWGFGMWGIVLYFLTGIRYFQLAVKSIRFPSKIIVN